MRTGSLVAIVDSIIVGSTIGSIRTSSSHPMFSNIGAPPFFLHAATSRGKLRTSRLPGQCRPCTIGTRALAQPRAVCSPLSLTIATPAVMWKVLDLMPSDASVRRGIHHGYASLLTVRQTGIAWPGAEFSIRFEDSNAQFLEDVGRFSARFHDPCACLVRTGKARRRAFFRRHAR